MFNPSHQSQRMPLRTNHCIRKGDNKLMANPLELIAYPDLASRVEAIERDGFAYFPHYLSPEEVAELRDCMDRTEIKPESFDRLTTDKGLTRGEGGSFYEKVINNAFNRDPLFMSFLDKPDIIDLAEAVHGDDCHVIGMTAWMTGPGRPEAGKTI